jgi:hypothetical protein
MTGGDQSKDGPRSGGRKGDPVRAARLRAALRENLRRRKSQARGRAQADAGEQAQPHDSAGFVAEIARDKSKR